MDGDRVRFFFLFFFLFFIFFYFLFWSFGALDCIYVLHLVLIFWLMMYLF